VRSAVEVAAALGSPWHAEAFGGALSPARERELAA
jgi:hypothetical protein